MLMSTVIYIASQSRLLPIPVDLAL